METALQNQKQRHTTLEEMQALITHQKKINDQFAQRIISWCFPRKFLTWETFLETKKNL